MNAKELMIGDWVHVDGKPQKVIEILHHGINPTYYSMSDEIEGYTHEEQIEPIPITKEILEKSGFVDDLYSENRFILKGKDEEQVFYWFEEYGRHNSCNVFGANIENSHGHYFSGRNIRYVHELQHALRMCNIEKEIVL